MNIPLKKLAGFFWIRVSADAFLNLPNRKFCSAKRIGEAFVVLEGHVVDKFILQSGAGFQRGDEVAHCFFSHRGLLDFASSCSYEVNGSAYSTFSSRDPDSDVPLDTRSPLLGKSNRSKFPA